MKNILQQILDTDREFSKYSQENNPAEAFKKYLISDAVMLPNNQNPVLGIDSIFQSMGPTSTDKLSWEPQGGKVSNDGTLGYTWGIYTMIIDSGKQYLGKYLNVWEKQLDGSYKVIADMGNSSP